MICKMNNGQWKWNISNEMNMDLSKLRKMKIWRTNENMEDKNAMHLWKGRYAPMNTYERVVMHLWNGRFQVKQIRNPSNKLQIVPKKLQMKYGQNKYWLAKWILDGQNEIINGILNGQRKSKWMKIQLNEVSKSPANHSWWATMFRLNTN